MQFITYDTDKIVNLAAIAEIEFRKVDSGLPDAEGKPTYDWFATFTLMDGTERRASEYYAEDLREAVLAAMFKSNRD